MSISLPNGRILANGSVPPTSAAVTRILHLSNFSPKLQTKHINSFFKEFEEKGSEYRVKWLDDTNALIVFADANTAKKAYLNFLYSPPAACPPPAKIRPYDQPDAAQIIAQISARVMGHRSLQSSTLHNASISSFAPPPPPAQRSKSPAEMAIPGVAETHRRGGSMTNGLSGFVMPTHKGAGAGSSSVFGTSAGAGSNIPLASRVPGNGNGNGNGTGRTIGMHGRSGSASSTWSRSAGGGGGVLNFGGMGGRLPTHSESPAPAPPLSRASSSEDDTIVLVDGRTGGGAGGLRRDSLSAERAMRRVERALSDVEAR